MMSRRIFSYLAAAVLMTSFSVGTASAHDTLVSMTPAIDSISYTAPTEVVLTFDEKISPIGTGLTVTAPDGARVDVGTPKIVGAALSVGLGPITINGHYLVNYRVVSADGHPVEASAGFDVLIASLTATTKAKIDVNAERENKIDKGEGRPEFERGLPIFFYVFFAVLLGGFFIFWRRRRNR